MIPIDIKELIVKRHNDGKSLREIAENISRLRSSVQYEIQKYNKNRSLEISPGRGRTKIIDARLGRKIERIVKLDPKTSAVQIAQNIKNDENGSLSAQIIRNFLHNNQHKACVSRMKTFISKTNIKLRFEYATKYLNMSGDFWKSVIFTDESKFNIFGSDGRRFEWWRLQLKKS